MPSALFAFSKACAPSCVRCNPTRVCGQMSLPKSTEATAVVCAALLCAFSRCSLAFFALIFLSFLVPLGWCQCFGRYHTKLPSSTTKKMAAAIQQEYDGGGDPASSLMTSSRLHPLGHLSHTLPRHLGMHARACKNTELVLPNLHWCSKQNL